MKIIYLVFFLLVFQEAHAQATEMIQGKVTDKLTHEPLAYVNLYLTGTGFGTVTNQSGNFILKYPASNKNDIVVFSHLGYKPFELSLNSITGKQLVITLEPQAFEMKEIVVKPLNPLDIVYNSLNKIPQNYNFQPHTVQSFQREHVRDSGNFIQLLEATFETKNAGTDSRPFSNIIDARYIEDKKEKAPLWNVSKGGFYTFGWTAVSGIENPSKSSFLGITVNQKSDLAKYYQFELKESIRNGKEELYVIAFDQKQQVKRPLLKGTIYIDSETEAVVKLTYALSPRGIKRLKPHETWGGKKISQSPKKIDIKQDRCEITYKKYGSKWYLNSWVTDTEFDASFVFFRVVLAQKNSLNLHSERVVTAIDTMAISDKNITASIADFGNVLTLQNFIKKNFENYKEVNAEKWANFNFIQADTSFASIARHLKLKNQDWEIFKKQQTLEKAMARSNFTSRQLAEDVNYLQETLEKVHPGLYWYTNKVVLENEFKNLKNKLEKKNTEAEFLNLVSPVIEKIHCGHTQVSPSLVRAEYQMFYQKLFPLQLWINGDSAMVTAGQDGISKGAKVLAINGNEMPAIVNRLKSGIASDGYNLTYKSFLLNHKFPALFARYFAGTDTFDLKIQNQNSQIKYLRISGKAESVEETIRSKEVKFSVYDSLQTAMLTIPSFSTGQDFPKFLQESFTQMRRNNIKKLILDLRNNQGGRDEFGLLLFSYLAQAPFSYYQNISVATIDTTVLNRLFFGEAAFNSAFPGYISTIQQENGAYRYTSHPNLGLHQPKENAFKGQVYILINGGTFSAAAEFAAIAHTNKRAVFIGEETGGGYYGNCSLGTPTLTLPNSQIRITIPLAKYELAINKSIPAGQGVIPDHQTRYSAPDILQNKDKDLEFCLRMIRKANK